VEQHVRTFRLPTVRSEHDFQRSPDLVRRWTNALLHVSDTEPRLRAALALAAPLASAQRAIVFDDHRIVAGVPGAPESDAMQRLFDRARRVPDDELVSSDLYVARLTPDGAERLALRWRSPSAASVEVARAIVASCACALDRHAATTYVSADLPDAAETLHRLRQLIHDASRMKRAFAVVYVVVETATSLAGRGTRDAIARNLRREVRANDHLGRLGDDAFVVLLSLESDESEAYPAAQRLQAAAAAGAHAPANVGVAVCPDDGVQPEDLLEKAGAAAMAAASAGVVQPYWYREAAGRMLHQHAALRARLRDGDPGDLLDVVYQPIVDAQTGALCGASATTVRHASDAFAPADLAAGTDRKARERLELWAIGRAAEAHRALAGDVPIHLALEATSEAALEAIASGFTGRHAAPLVWVEITADPSVPPQELEAFARRLHALGAAVGAGAWRTGGAPFDMANGLLDFVTVDAGAGSDVRTLAGLAAGAMFAPAVLATGARDREHARWLARNGATALSGDGISARKALGELVGWARNHSGAVGS
jgi:GGDEF domain-containing protein